MHLHGAAKPGGATSEHTAARLRNGVGLGKMLRSKNRVTGAQRVSLDRAGSVAAPAASGPKDEDADLAYDAQKFCIGPAMADVDHGFDLLREQLANLESRQGVDAAVKETVDSCVNIIMNGVSGYLHDLKDYWTFQRVELEKKCDREIKIAQKDVQRRRREV